MLIYKKILLYSDGISSRVNINILYVNQLIRNVTIKF